MSGKILKTRVEEEGEEPWPGKSSSDGESVDSFGERKLFLVEFLGGENETLLFSFRCCSES